MNHGMLQQDHDERILAVVKRSLFGVWPHLLFSALAFLALLGVVFLAASGKLSNVSGAGNILLFAGLGWALVELIIYVLIITYLGNKLIVTNESLVQRLQNTLFHQKTSQLMLTDIQDVTFSQNGFFAHTFNFGSINVETAGEQVNFVFTFARNPAEKVRIIIEAQEACKEPALATQAQPITTTPPIPPPAMG
jgi:uncharacterized membrane protein YdbT with pleckstrin-like domain